MVLGDGKDNLSRSRVYETFVVDDVGVGGIPVGFFDILVFRDIRGANSVGWTTGRLTRGWDAHVEMTQQFLGSLSFINLNLQNPTFDVRSEDLAVVSFRYSVDLQRVDTTRDPYSGLGIQVWARGEDDVWRIQHHLMSRND